MKLKLTSVAFFLLFILLGTNVAQAVTFKNYDELNDCVDFYNTFSQYKKNLQKCFEEKDIKIDKDSLKLIKKDYGLIDSIIDLNLPEEKIIKKPKKKLSNI